MRDSLTVTIVYVLVVWALLALFAGPIAACSAPSGLARELIIFFCHFAAGSFLFNGAHVRVKCRLQQSRLSDLFDPLQLGPLDAGVIPFVWVGAHYFGAKGVIAGWGLGAVVFGDRFDGRLLPHGRRHRRPSAARRTGSGAAAGSQSPFSTGKAPTLQIASVAQPPAPLLLAVDGLRRSRASARP